MTTRTGSRAALRVALALGAALVVTTGAAASSGLLGARVSPKAVVWESGDRTVRVLNQSTIPALVTVTPTGEGWTLDTTEPFVLQPDEERFVHVVTPGKSDATYEVHLTSADRTPGIDQSALVMTGTLRHATVWEQLPWQGILGGVALTALLLFGLAALGRRVARGRGRMLSTDQINHRLEGRHAPPA